MKKDIQLLENKVYPADIDDYISSFSEPIQERLKALLATVRQAAPGAAEVISYQMPTFKTMNTNLVHFAAYDHHIGFYPAPSAIEHFHDELKNYKTSKGAIQFKHSEPIPHELITQMVHYRVAENKAKVEHRKILSNRGQ